MSLRTLGPVRALSSLVGTLVIVVVTTALVALTTGGGQASAQPTRSTTELVADPGFETGGPPCFTRARGGEAHLRRTTKEPLAGAASLTVRLAPQTAVACVLQPAATSDRVLGVNGSVDVRAVRPAAGAAARLCLKSWLVGVPSPLRACRVVRAGTAPSTQVSLDLAGHDEPLRRVAWTLATGRRSAKLLVDEVHLAVESETAPPGTSSPSASSPTGTATATPTQSPTTTPPGVCVPSSMPAPHGPPAPGPCNENEAPGASSYVPTVLNLPATRPFISLTDYTAAPASDPVATRFKAYVDRAVAGSPDYGYSPADAIVQYARTGTASYLTTAIAQVDATVKAAEQAIVAGRAPEIAGDSYLEVGWEIEALALTYDRGYSQLTSSQRSRWKAFGDQAIANVWSPQLATWGTRPAGTFDWTGWSINNPGNNYNYSFIQATQLWALATQDRDWMQFLQTWKFPLLTNYYTTIPGGGSREGTGYGTAQRRLWENARMWARSTGEHLTAVEKHARDSIDYWVHATIPTLDQFNPVGDLSRQSVPELYDYQENLVREAAMAAPGTAQAGRALWWIAHNSVPDTMANSFNLRNALLKPTGTATAPTALIYAATGVGQYFARSAWSTGATWLSVIAGPYDESHAHMEQGSFNIARNGWRAVTSNIWSHSGLQGNGDDTGDLGTKAANILRFDTSTKPLRQYNATSTATQTVTGDSVKVHADLTPAYARHNGKVTSWTRDVTLTGAKVTVSDRCTVASGVTPVWQLNVPTQPTKDSAGHVSAGGLALTFDPAYVVKLVNLHTENSDLNSGWRIELTKSGACAFDVTID